MYNSGKMVSLERVLEKVYRDWGFDDISWSDVIEWSSEAINLIGVYPSYVDKISKKITLENGRGDLPCDLMYIKMVRDFSTKETLARSSDQFHLSNYYRCENEVTTNCDDCDEYVKTYTVNENYIFTSYTDGDLEIAYTAMATDERGLPLIPDDDKFIRAVSLYIAERIATKLFIQDKLRGDKLQLISQEKDWAFGSAKMAMIIPDIDTMEMWKNSFLRLIPTINSHSAAFKYDSQPQQQRNLNSY